MALEIVKTDVKNDLTSLLIRQFIVLSFNHRVHASDTYVGIYIHTYFCLYITVGIKMSIGR